MKRSFAFFGILGALSGAASAQSAVTLYGQLDLSYQYLSSGDRSPLGGAHLHRLADGTSYGPGSRWGIRVSEDLGGGLRAGAVLESGLLADTGVQGNGGRAFGRQVYVSLASAQAGELRLGRQYSFHDQVMSINNPFGSSTLLNPGAGNTLSTGVMPLFIDAVRMDNMVQYLSPNFGGFSLQAAVALGEGLVDRYQGLKANYGNGPLNLSASYEWSEARVGTADVSNAGDKVNKILGVGGNYDFKAVKLFGGYQRGTDLTPGSSAIITAPAPAGGIGTQIGSFALPGLTGPATQLTAYTVGASIPVGVATVGANYTRTKYENAVNDARTLGRLAAGATYAFSKQTLVYGAVAVHNGDLKEDMNERNIFQLGLRKAF